MAKLTIDRTNCMLTLCDHCEGLTIEASQIAAAGEPEAMSITIRSNDQRLGNCCAQLLFDTPQKAGEFFNKVQMDLMDYGYDPFDDTVHDKIDETKEGE